MAGQMPDQFGRQGAVAAGGLEPIGVFWDIENCQVPKGKPATAVVQCIRQHFIDSYTEEEFLCVCDIRKESKEVIQELNLAQVTVVHVNATCKNAADDKLKQCMRRFVDTYGPQATLMLISGDVNFSTELSDFRHRRKVHVILVHGSWAPEALTVCAHKCYSYPSLVATVPFRSPTKGHPKLCEIVVNDLPENKDNSLLQNRLRQLSDNCGGRVLGIVGRTAYLRFPTPDSARRACKRMDGEDVFGSKISVSLHTGRKGSKQFCGDEQGNAGGSNSIVQQFPLQSSSAREDSGVSQLTYSNRRDTWHSAENESVSGDSPSKNVGRVSPFLFSGEKSQDHECLGLLPSGNSPLQTRPATELLPRQLNTSYSHYAQSSASDRWHTGKGTAQNASTGTLPSYTSPANAVELHVTNIDCHVETRDITKLLLAHFQEHVVVEHISLVSQEDGTLNAHVRVPTMNDALVAVSKLHRLLIGRRRINVAVAEDATGHLTTSSPSHCTNLQLIHLLRDAPHGTLPLFRLKELFENRYNSSITISEIQKLHDDVTIVDKPSGRMVVLNTRLRSRSGSSPYVIKETDTLHVSQKARREPRSSPILGRVDGWAQWEKTLELLPKVCISLGTLGPRVHALLDRHNGSLPINSFLACYEAEFGAIPRTSDREPWRQGCVHLEHLIASLPGVRIDTSPLGTKRVTWIENSKEKKIETSSRNKCSGERLEQLALEAVELLKAQTDSCIALHFFVPAYNQHFNQQCRITDYGFTRLLDLLHAMSHVIQILGQGQNRLLTLTHKAQIDRFISDITQVLRMQQNKEVRLTDLQEAYQSWHHCPLVAADYGSCYIEDLLADASAFLLMVPRGNEMFITLRRKDDCKKPSLEELERRRQFACEVVDMLKHSPTCSVLFHKFAPAYHHHFGRQCRIADYGCTKLAELFDTIAGIVQVAGEGDARCVQLCLPQRLQIEQERISAILDTLCDTCLTGQKLEEAYITHHGFPLQWEQLGFDSIQSFLHSLGDLIQVEDTRQLVTVDMGNLQQEMNRMTSLLMGRLDGSMDLEELWQLHHSYYGTYPQMRAVKHLEARRTARVDRTEGRIVLLPLHLTARDIISLIQQHAGQLPLKKLEEFFLKRFGTPIIPSGNKFSSVTAMLDALSEYFILEGPKQDQIVRLQWVFASSEPKFGSTQEGPKESDLLLTLQSSQEDLLSSPIPSCVPSPVLSPLMTSSPCPGDLMQFEAAHEVDSLLGLLDLDPLLPASMHQEWSASTCQDSSPISPPSFADSLGPVGSPSRLQMTRLAAKFSASLEQ